MAANNLVELRGRQGATVRAIKAEALIEMFQVMAELEVCAARLRTDACRGPGDERNIRYSSAACGSGETGISTCFTTSIRSSMRQSMKPHAMLSGDQTRKLRNR